MTAASEDRYRSIRWFLDSWMRSTQAGSQLAGRNLDGLALGWLYGLDLGWLDAVFETGRAFDKAGPARLSAGFMVKMPGLPAGFRAG